MWVVSESGDDKQGTAFDARVREIRCLPAHEAFTAASELVKPQAAFRAQAADIRAEQALRIWNSESRPMRLSGKSKKKQGLRSSMARSSVNACTQSRSC